MQDRVGGGSHPFQAKPNRSKEQFGFVV